MDRVVNQIDIFDHLIPTVAGETLVPNDIIENQGDYVIRYTPNIGTARIPIEGSNEIRFYPIYGAQTNELVWEDVPVPNLKWRKFTDSRGDFYYLVNEEGHIVTDGINCFRAMSLDGEIPTNWTPINIGSDIVAIQREWGDSVLVLYRGVYYNAYIITYTPEEGETKTFEFIDNKPRFTLNEYR